LKVARSERVGGASRAAGPDERDEARMPAASFSPMIDISEKSLRDRWGGFRSRNDPHCAGRISGRTRSGLAPSACPVSNLAFACIVVVS